MSDKKPADTLMLEIAGLRMAGKWAEADSVLGELKRSHPRADNPVTEEVLQMMMKNMPIVR